MHPGVRIAVAVDQQHVAQFGQPFSQSCDLAAVQRGGGHQHGDVALLEALVDGLGPEGREQGAEDRPCLEGAERSGVELGNPAGEGDDPFAAAYAEHGEHLCEPAGGFGKFGVGEVGHRVVAVDEAQRHPVGQEARSVAVDRLVGDVQAASRETFEAGLSVDPPERGVLGVVVDEVGYPVGSGGRRDRVVAHQMSTRTSDGIRPVGPVGNVDIRMISIPGLGPSAQGGGKAAEALCTRPALETSRPML